MAYRLSLLASFLVLTFAIPIVPVSAQNSALTPELLSKMLDHSASNGIDRVANPIVANRLGISVAGQTWPMRQIGVEETAGGILHNVSFGRGSDQNIVVSAKTKERLNAYRIRRDGTLLAAFTYDIATHGLADIAQAEAHKGLAAELLFWSEHLK
jgi:hypothetical protein